MPEDRSQVENTANNGHTVDVKDNDGNVIDTNWCTCSETSDH